MFQNTSVLPTLGLGSSAQLSSNMFDGTFPRASSQRAVDNDAIHSAITRHRGALPWECSSGAAQSHWTTKCVGVGQGATTTMTAMKPALKIIPYGTSNFLKQYKNESNRTAFHQSLFPTDDQIVLMANLAWTAIIQQQTDGMVSFDV
jgi:hypothetical protein